MGQDWLDEARRRLLDLRRGRGAWGYRGDSAPAAEPSSLAALALLAALGGRDDAVPLASARRIASTQRPDGSLEVVDGLLGVGWPSTLALLLWSSLPGFEVERSKALAWLLELKGETMLKAADDPMGHDPSIVGWPWVAGTHSWVEPTAMALLALSKEGKLGHPRAREGVRLLIDRAIPSGGWNLGNPVVFHTPLRPLPGPTGLALLALSNSGGRPEVVSRAVDYLRKALASTLAPISLGWGLLGLRAWGEEPVESARWLASSFQALEARGPRAVELAMLLLASGPRSLELLGAATPSSSPLPPGEGPGVRGVAQPVTRIEGSNGHRPTFHDPHPGPLPGGEAGRGSLRSNGREAAHA